MSNPSQLLRRGIKLSQAAILPVRTACRTGPAVGEAQDHPPATHFLKLNQSACPVFF